MQDFLIGSATSILVMLAHLAGTILIVFGIKRLRSKFRDMNILYVSVILVFVYGILMIVLFASTGIWAALYYNLNLVEDWGNAFYSALVNYTTLGFGDLVQASRTRIYASGILMFSWAAAILVYVLQAHLPAMIQLTVHTPHNKRADH